MTREYVFSVLIWSSARNLITDAKLCVRDGNKNRKAFSKDLPVRCGGASYAAPVAAVSLSSAKAEKVINFS